MIEVKVLFMSILVLRNHDTDAPVQELRFDLKLGCFITDANQPISRYSLESELVFKHPILDEPPLSPVGTHQYVYHYDNEEQFYLALRVAYATLLQSEHPSLCSIHIQPSAQYVENTRFYNLYFSSHPKKPAKQQVTTHALNHMLQKLYGKPFQYSNQILMDYTVTWVDLPAQLDADELYTQAAIAPARGSEHQYCLDRYELRFLNTHIGFGIFTRTAIQQGEVIAQYCGNIVSKNTDYLSYCYNAFENSGYNLLLDAYHCGNFTRFINHAPEPSTQLIPAKCLSANVGVENHPKYGNHCILFIASRDIAAGEQVLFSYGERYFGTNIPMSYVKANGVFVDKKQRRLKNVNTELKKYLSVFADFGDRRAQWSLLKKPIMVLALGILMGLWFQEG